MLTNSDKLLWNRFLSGDDDAYINIYHLHVKQMYNYGINFTTDKEFVKDCIHDVFTKLYSNRKTLGFTDNIKMYLYVALKNRIVELLKRQVEFYDIAYIEQTDLHEDHFSEYEDFIQNESLHEKIGLILETLSPRQREAVYYRYVENLSYEEITKLMGMNYQSVHNLIQRAIKKLKKMFKYSALITFFILSVC